MSATTPPNPDGDPWPVDYVSTNGAKAVAGSESADRLVVLGYITAVAIPLIGLIVGIVVLTRPGKANSRHGVLIIVVSLIASVAWILVFTSGALTATSNDLN
jgi:hypothetical protein